MKKKEFKELTEENYKKCLRVIGNDGCCEECCNGCPFKGNLKYCNEDMTDRELLENAMVFVELYRDSVSDNKKINENYQKCLSKIKEKNEQESYVDSLEKRIKFLEDVISYCYILYSREEIMRIDNKQQYVDALEVLEKEISLGNVDPEQGENEERRF